MQAKPGPSIQASYQEIGTILYDVYPRYFRHQIWQDKVPNTEILARCHTTGIEAGLISSQLRWCGHFTRMLDRRLPKAVFYAQLASGTRPVERPLLRFKDRLKVIPE